MIVADLPAAELGRRLRGDGITLELGPFLLSLRSPFDDLPPLLRAMYGAHRLAAADAVPDATVELVPVRRPAAHAVFRVDGGAPVQPFPRGLAWPYVEWGLNWAIGSHMHQLLMVHGAVVERGGHGLMLPGLSGSGKSTLCMALVARGWRLLSDEFLLLAPDTGQLLPLPRPMALKGRSIDLARARTPSGTFSPEFPDTHKGRLAYLAPPPGDVARQQEAAAPRWLVFPRFEPGTRTALLPLRRGQAWLALGDNSFNYQTRGADGFREVGRLVRAVSCHRLAFADLDAAADLLDGLASA